MKAFITILLLLTATVTVTACGSLGKCPTCKPDKLR